MENVGDDRDERDGLLFDVQRSIRYHDRRTVHFERLERVNSLFTILLAGIVLMDVLGPSPSSSEHAGTGWNLAGLWPKVLALGGAIFGAVDLVVGFARVADQHRHLKRKFCQLEQEFPDLTTKDILRRRLAIEVDEPPVYRALDTLCYNELCVARGQPAPFQIDWIAKRTANWFRWPDLAVSVVDRKEKSSIH